MIITRESLFEYQIKKAISSFKKTYDIEETGEELQDLIWSEYAEEFGKLMLETIDCFGGDELFE